MVTTDARRAAVFSSGDSAITPSTQSAVISTLVHTWDGSVSLENHPLKLAAEAMSLYHVAV